jgi:hypothetical protein
MAIFSNEQLQVPSKTWQIALESASGAWMDASGVQGYLLKHISLVICQDTGLVLHDIMKA